MAGYVVGNFQIRKTGFVRHLKGFDIALESCDCRGATSSNYTQADYILFKRYKLNALAWARARKLQNPILS